jgi:hypothetical protein
MRGIHYLKFFRLKLNEVKGLEGIAIIFECGLPNLMENCVLNKT